MRPSDTERSHNACQSKVTGGTKGVHVHPGSWEVLDALCQCLEGGGAPQHVHVALAWNGLSEACVHRLCAALEGGACPEHLYLDLDGTDLPFACVQRLCDALVSGACPTHTHLRLARFKLSTQCMAALCTALTSPRCPAGFTLHLLQCKLTERCAQLLDAALGERCAVTLTLDEVSLVHCLPLTLKGMCCGRYHERFRLRILEGSCVDIICDALESHAVDSPMHIELAGVTPSGIARLCDVLESGCCPPQLHLTVGLPDTPAALHRLLSAAASPWCPPACTLTLTLPQEPAFPRMLTTVLSAAPPLPPQRLTLDLSGARCDSTALLCIIVAEGFPANVTLLLSEATEAVCGVLQHAAGPVGLRLVVQSDAPQEAAERLSVYGQCEVGEAVVGGVVVGVVEVMPLCGQHLALGCCAAASHSHTHSVESQDKDSHPSKDITALVTSLRLISNDTFSFRQHIDIDTVTTARTTYTAAMQALREDRTNASLILSRDDARTAYITTATQAVQSLPQAKQMEASLHTLIESLKDWVGGEDCTESAVETAARCLVEVQDALEETRSSQRHAASLAHTYATSWEHIAQVMRDAHPASISLSVASAQQLGTTLLSARTAAATAEASLRTLRPKGLSSVLTALQTQWTKVRALIEQIPALQKVLCSEEQRVDRGELEKGLAGYRKRLDGAEDAMEDAGIAERRARRDGRMCAALSNRVAAAAAELHSAQHALEAEEAVAAAATVLHYPELNVAAATRDWGGLLRRRRLRDYKDLRPLSEGRHLVWQAQRKGETVVLKHFATTPSQSQRMLREARALQRIKHPCVAELTCLFEGEVGWYMEMPYYSGGDLSQYVKCNPNKTTKKRIGLDVSVGLACVHRHGLVHCDVKPQNIFIDADGSARLGDFDVSRDTTVRHVTITSTTTTTGTPGYLAPEVATEGNSTAADVYSLGLVFYDLLVATPRGGGLGRPDNERDALLPLHTVPTEETALLSCMLATDPKRRPTAEGVGLDPYFRGCGGGGVDRSADLRAPAVWACQEARGDRTDMTAELGAQFQCAVDTGLCVEKVLRIEHVDLWEAYQLKRAQLARRPSCTPLSAGCTVGPGVLLGAVNERQLFHGTTRWCADAITNEGMDERVCKWGLYGAGLYFAEDAAKADTYMSPAEDGCCDLLVCRVLLGAAHTRTRPLTEAHRAARRPPCIHGHDPCDRHAKADSVVGCVPGLPREFVVYDRTHVYPEYLLRVRRV